MKKYEKGKLHLYIRWKSNNKTTGCSERKAAAIYTYKYELNKYTHMHTRVSFTRKVHYTTSGDRNNKKENENS